MSSPIWWFEETIFNICPKQTLYYDIKETCQLLLKNLKVIEECSSFLVRGTLIIKWITVKNLLKLYLLFLPSVEGLVPPSSSSGESIHFTTFLFLRTLSPIAEFRPSTIISFSLSFSNFFFWSFSIAKDIKRLYNVTN